MGGGRSKEDGDRLFSVVLSDMTRGNRHKLKHRKCHVNVTKNVFCEGSQAGCSEGIARFRSLELWRNQLDMVLGKKEKKNLDMQKTALQF